MLLPDLLQEVYASVTVNKTRTGLTILGIVIGIASVIIMVAIGRGAQESIQANIEAIGSNLLLVRPGAQQGPGSTVRGEQGSARTLTLADASALMTNVPTIEAIAPEVSSRKQVTAEGKNTNTSITGVSENYATVRNVSLSSGVFITAQHVTGLAKVAVLGPEAATALFGLGGGAVGKRIRIGTTDFTVIGVTTPRGGTGFGSSDDVIYIPLSTAQQFITGSDYVSMLSVKVTTGEDMTETTTLVKNTLLTAHRISDPEQADFSVFNQADIVATATTVTNTLTILLGAIAGISLIVGGIGIMNMMLTTVTERTREIGLRKAIGAESQDIRTQFLLEAIVLTAVGGMLGILLGWIVASLMNSYGITASISSGSILLATVVSMSIGIIFGYYPAHRASRFNPIEALRYE